MGIVPGRIRAGIRGAGSGRGAERAARGSATGRPGRLFEHGRSVRHGQPGHRRDGRAPLRESDADADRGVRDLRRRAWPQGRCHGRSLQFATPSLVVNNFGQGNDFNVRGIGKAEHNTQTTTGVITYRDGVPTFPGYFQEEPYFDIANIQVLRGTAGHDRRPERDRRRGVRQHQRSGHRRRRPRLPQGQFGNYNDLGGEGAINLPVSDTFAMRLAVHGEQRDGFYHITGPGGARTPATMATCGCLPAASACCGSRADRLSILSKTDLDYLDMGAYPADPITGPVQVLPCGSRTPNPNYHGPVPHHRQLAAAARATSSSASILRIEYDFDSGVKLRSISALPRKGNTASTATDLDGTSADLPILGLRCATSRLRQRRRAPVLAGVQHDLAGQASASPGCSARSACGTNTTSRRPTQFRHRYSARRSGFPNYYSCRAPIPKRSLAAVRPGRLQDHPRPEARSRRPLHRRAARPTMSTSSGNSALFVTPTSRPPSRTISRTRRRSAGRSSPDHYLYAFVATGFRPGGLNVPGRPRPPRSVQARRRSRSFEAGWKANFAGGHIRTTIDGFYNDYGTSRSIIGYRPIPGVRHRAQRAGHDQDLRRRGRSGLQLRRASRSMAGINVLHSGSATSYASRSRARVGVRRRRHAITGPAAAPPASISIGRDQTYAPNFTFNFGAEYAIRARRRRHADAAGQFRPCRRAMGDAVREAWRSATGSKQRNILNAQLAWQHGSWTVTAYAHQPHQPALCRRAQQRPRFRRAAAPIRRQGAEDF